MKGLTMIDVDSWKMLKGQKIVEYGTGKKNRGKERIQEKTKKKMDK